MQGADVVADIVSLKTFATQSNEETVAILREYLEMAERGEIVVAAVVGIEPNGASRTQCSASDHFQGLLGAISILQHRMIESCRTVTS